MGWGAIMGIEKLSVCVGIMSERALKELTTGRKIAIGSDYSIVSCLPMEYAGLHSKRYKCNFTLLYLQSITASLI